MHSPQQLPHVWCASQCFVGIGEQSTTIVILTSNYRLTVNLLVSYLYQNQQEH